MSFAVECMYENCTNPKRTSVCFFPMHGEDQPYFLCTWCKRTASVSFFVVHETGKVHGVYTLFEVQLDKDTLDAELNKNTQIDKVPRIDTSRKQTQRFFLRRVGFVIGDDLMISDVELDPRDPHIDRRMTCGGQVAWGVYIVSFNRTHVAAVEIEALDDACHMVVNLYQK